LMVEVSALPSAPAPLLGVIDYHGELLPVVDLRVRMGLPRRAPDIDSMLVIVTTPRRTVALAADEIVGVREAPPGRLHDPTEIDPALRQVAGVVALDDELVIIHDVEALLSTEDEQALEQVEQ